MRADTAAATRGAGGPLAEAVFRAALAKAHPALAGVEAGCAACSFGFDLGPLDGDEPPLERHGASLREKPAAPHDPNGQPDA